MIQTDKQTVILQRLLYDGAADNNYQTPWKRWNKDTTTKITRLLGYFSRHCQWLEFSSVLFTDADSFGRPTRECPACKIHTTRLYRTWWPAELDALANHHYNDGRLVAWLVFNGVFNTIQVISCQNDGRESCLRSNNLKYRTETDKQTNRSCQLYYNVN